MKNSIEDQRQRSVFLRTNMSEQNFNVININFFLIIIALIYGTKKEWQFLKIITLLFPSEGYKLSIKKSKARKIIALVGTKPNGIGWHWKQHRTQKVVLYLFFSLDFKWSSCSRVCLDVFDRSFHHSKKLRHYMFVGRLEVLQLLNWVTQNDVTLRVLNSNIFTEILLSSF